MLSSVSKMKLVPVDNLLQRISYNEKQPAAIETVNTQVRMEQVLKNSQLPSDVKVKLINDLLIKEQNLRQQSDDRSSTTTVTPHGPSYLSAPTNMSPVSSEAVLTEAENNSKRGELSSHNVSRLMPKNSRDRAERLLQFMDSTIDWTNRGELIGNNDTPIVGTSIVDLVRYGVNAGNSVISRGRKPKGWQDFENALRLHNVPSTLAPGLDGPGRGFIHARPHHPIKRRAGLLSSSVSGRTSRRAPYIQAEIAKGPQSLPEESYQDDSTNAGPSSRVSPSIRRGSRNRKQAKQWEGY